MWFMVYQYAEAGSRLLHTAHKVVSRHPLRLVREWNEAASGGRGTVLLWYNELSLAETEMVGPSPASWGASVEHGN